MPKGYSKDRHPEMYEIVQGVADKVRELRRDKYSEYYNDSMPFLMKAWNRYLTGDYNKSDLLKVVSSLAAIWEHKS